MPDSILTLDDANDVLVVRRVTTANNWPIRHTVNKNELLLATIEVAPVVDALVTNNIAFTLKREVN